MNKIKKILIVLIILIILLLILTIVLNKMQTGEIKKETKTNEEIQILKDRNIFYTIEKISKLYYNYIIPSDINDNSKEIYSILDKNYIEEYNLTKNNVNEKIYKTENVNISVDKIYVAKLSDSIEKYITYISLQNNNLENSSNIIIITLDSINKTFSIMPYEYVKEKGYDKLKIGEKLNIKFENIKQNEFNKFIYSNINDETYIKNLFFEFKNNILYNRIKLYELLNEEYRNERFPTFDNFNEYIQNNINYFMNISLYKYKIDNTENYKQYICMDEDEKYYIFRETSVMQYNIILDSYRIDLPEFLEKYNSATPKEKGILNLQRFLEAIKEKDYNYSYKCLSKDFRNNYFKTLESFQIYIENNYYINNKFDNVEFLESNDLNIYKVNVYNGDGFEYEYFEKTFIIKLGEGTNFELSFNIE